LRAKTVTTRLINELAGPFDFSPDSVVLKELVARAVRLFEQYHSQHEPRAPLHHLAVEHHGQRLHVPLLAPDMLDRLAWGETWSRVFSRSHEELFRQLLLLDESVRLDDVRALVCPAALSPARSRPGSGLAQNSPTWTPTEEALDFDRLREELRIPRTLQLPAPSALEVPPQLLDTLEPIIQEENRSPATARLLATRLYQGWAETCPPTSDLQPGQCMALALAVNDRNMRLPADRRRHVPVKLTVYTQPEVEELSKQDKLTVDNINQLLASRAARLLAEAYAQGGLLSFTHLAFLLQVSAGKAGNLINRFEAQHRLVLPSPGTIHDMGCKFTHKALVINLYLQGLDTKEVARRTYHSAEAVSSYIRSFETLLLLVAHELPENLMPRIMRLGQAVVRQHLDLIQDKIGDATAVNDYVHNRGLLPQHQPDTQEATA